jgi:hypothetical protein
MLGRTASHNLPKLALMNSEQAVILPACEFVGFHSQGGLENEWRLAAA